MAAAVLSNRYISDRFWPAWAATRRLGHDP